MALIDHLGLVEQGHVTPHEVLIIYMWSRIRSVGASHHPPAYRPVVMRAMRISSVRHITHPPIAPW